MTILLAYIISDTSFLRHVVRKSHIISRTFALFFFHQGTRVVDEPLTEEQMMGEALAMVMGNTK